MIILFALLLAQDPEETIRTEDLRRHIEYLVSPKLEGRNNGTPGGKLAREYVAAEMKRIGLKPGGTEGYYQAFESGKGRFGKTGPLAGVNVIGIVEGTDRKEEFIVVNAHHDHLGIVKGNMRPGADDNASGVAAILELAEAFAKRPARRSILVVSFDCEEDGLVGSREFVRSGLYKPERIAADFCFDIFGGNFYPWDTKRIYALGSESSPELTRAVARHKVGGVEVAQGGIFIIEPFGFSRSDYRNFRDKKIPYVFFSVGSAWYYHSSHDTIDKINWPKITAATRFSYRVIREVADADARPAFREGSKPTAREAEMMREGVERVLASKEIRMTPRHREQGEGHVARLKAILARGEVGEKDRGEIQRAMIWLFRVQAYQIGFQGR